MTPIDRINPVEFVQRVKPVLEARDCCGLLSLLKANWTADQITQLLACPDLDARKVAALALSLVGGRCCVRALADQLKHPDAMVNQMAEHALWSIWFRLGMPEANHQLCRGTQALNQRDYEHAIEHFSRAIELDEHFAEAYNQRALAEYLLERYDASVADCRKAVDLMPCHFGAWAGMGHGYAHVGNLVKAIRCYRKAIEINPHLECLCEAVTELQRQCGDQ